MTNDKVDVTAAPLDIVIEILRNDDKTVFGVEYRPPGGVATQILYYGLFPGEDILERMAEMMEENVREMEERNAEEKKAEE
jgi:hypothetical protein